MQTTLASEHGGDTSDVKALLAEIRAFPDGADLLLTALYTAAHHYRHSSICTPYPGEPFTATASPGASSSGSSSGAATQQQQQQRNHGALQRALASLPAVRSLLLEANLAGLPPDCRALLSWLLLNRARVRRFLLVDWAAMAGHLRDLDPTFAAPALAPNVAPSYILRALDPSGAAPFADCVVAYHGTHLENLHSIIHTGLQNLSGTKLQRTGAIFGNGIYLSTDYAVGFSFAEPHKSWPLSRFGSQARVLLVCLVDKSKAGTASGETKPGSEVPDKYLVVQRADAVRLLYALVYTDQSHTKAARVNWCTVLIALYAGFLVLKALWTALHQPF